MTSTEMMKTKLPDDSYIWKNIAVLGAKPDWRTVKKPAGWGYDPFNHGLLFGYEPAELLKKQYK